MNASYAFRWVTKLMQHPRTDLRLMAVRILEVREAYCSAQFDFEKMKYAALHGIRDENQAVMAQYLDATMAGTAEGQGDSPHPTEQSKE